MGTLSDKTAHDFRQDAWKHQARCGKSPLESGPKGLTQGEARIIGRGIMRDWKIHDADMGGMGLGRLV